MQVDCEQTEKMVKAIESYKQARQRGDNLDDLQSYVCGFFFEFYYYYFDIFEICVLFLFWKCSTNQTKHRGLKVKLLQ